MSHSMLTLLIILIIPILTLALLAAAVASARRSRRQRLPYTLRPALLSAAERACYLALAQAVGTRWLICPQVRLADLLTLPRQTPGRQAHLNRILAKHLDFVLVEPASFAPVLGIELDDRTHQRPGRRERDAFVDQACANAGLPLLRLRAGLVPATADLATQIRRAVEGLEQASA